MCLCRVRQSRCPRCCCRRRRQEDGDVVGHRRRSSAADGSGGIRDDRSGLDGMRLERMLAVEWTYLRSGGCGSRWSLSPAGARSSVAARVAGSGAEPRARGRAAPGPGPASDQDRRDRSGGDHRAGAGRSWPCDRRTRRWCIGEMAAWAQHGRGGSATRTATKNQLLGQLDRAFPGLTLALPDVFGTKIGRLIAAEFTDPTRLAALGVTRLIRFAAVRDVQFAVRSPSVWSPPPRDALPTRDAVVARRVLAADVVLVGRVRCPDQRCRDRTGQAAAVQPVRHPDLGARLGRSPCLQLRCSPG